MADNTIQGLAISIAMDDSSFQQGVQGLKRNLDVIQSEFQASMSGIKDFGDSLDGLKEKASMLGEKIQVQEQIVSKYREQLEQAQETLQENAEKMMNLKDKVDQAKSAWEEASEVESENIEITQKLKTAYEEARQSENENIETIERLRAAYEKASETESENAESTVKLKSKYEDLQGQYAEAEDSVLRNSKAVDGYNIQINKQQSNLNNMRSDLDETNSKIDEQSGVFNTVSNVASVVHDKMTGLMSGLRDSFYATASAAADGAGLFEVTEKAAEAGDAVYELSQKLHLNTQEAALMSRTLSVTGTDTQPVVDTMNSLDKSIESAGKNGNSTTKALDKFGVKLTDAHGKLLPITDQLQQLSDGYKKAAANGNEEAYAAQVLGTKGEQLIPMLQEYTEAKEEASKVKGIGLDSAEAHKTEEELQVLKMQTGQLGLTFANALMPVAEALAPKLQSAFANLAKTIKSHQSEIKSFANNIISAGEGVVNMLAPVVKGFINFVAQHGAAAGKIVKIIALNFLIFSPAEKIISGVHHQWKNLSDAMESDDFASAISHIKNFGGSFTGLGESIKGAVPKVTDGLKGIGSGMSKVIVGPYKAFVNGIRGLPSAIGNISLEGVVSKITTPFKHIPSVLNGVKGNFISFGSGVKKSFLGLGSTIVEGAPKILAGFKKAFTIKGIISGASKAFSFITSPWSILILVIMAGVGAIIANWSKIKSFAKSIFGGSLPTSMNQFKAIFSTIWKDIQKVFSNVWNNIKKIASQVWAVIGPTIIGGVKQIKSFWNQVWPEIKEVFVEVWDIMKGVLAPTVTVLYVIISTGIGVIKGAWSSAWKAIGDYLKLVWDGITGVIKVAWDVVSGVIKVGLDLLTGHWGKAWSDFKDIFKNVWDDLGKMIINIGKDALQWGKDIINGIINGIKGGLSALGDAVGNVAKTVWSFLHHSTPEEGPMQDDDQWMPDFMTNMAQGIINNKSLVTTAMNSVTEGIKASMQSVSSLNVGVNPITSSSALKSAAATPQTIAKSVTNNESQGKAMNNSLSKGLTGSSDVIAKSVNDLNNKVDTTMTSQVNKNLQYGQQTDKNLSAGITQNAQAVTNSLNTLLNTQTNNTNDFVKSYVKQGETTGKNLSTGINNQSALVINTANNLTNTVGNNLNTFSTESIKYGQQTDNSIANGLTNTLEVITNAVNNLVNSVKNQLQTFASMCNTYGNEIVTSMIAGIQSQESNLTSVVTDLTNKVIQAFQQGFDIHSPSRKTFWLGTMLPAGLMNGIKSVDLNNFINKWLSSITSSMGSGMSGQVSGWLTEALALTGQSMSALPALEQIAQHESGGNPLAVNNWDINAAEGHPSKGLMQMIDETFNQYKMPGMDNIFNGLDNAVSAIRYMVAKYGSIMNVPGIKSMASGGSYVGYKDGTLNATPGWHWVGENGPELMKMSGGETVLNAADSLGIASGFSSLANSINSMKFTSPSASGYSVSNITNNYQTTNNQSAADTTSSGNGDLTLNIDHLHLNGYSDVKKLARDMYNIQKNYNAGRGQLA